MYGCMAVLALVWTVQLIWLGVVSVRTLRSGR